MPDPDTSPDGESESHPELLEELDRHKEEILRLRDLLIGKDAELEAIKWRIAQLEERRPRYKRFTDRLQARLPSAARRQILRLRNPSR